MKVLKLQVSNAKVGRELSSAIPVFVFHDLNGTKRILVGLVFKTRGAPTRATRINLVLYLIEANQSVRVEVVRTQWLGHIEAVLFG